MSDGACIGVCSPLGTRTRRYRDVRRRLRRDGMANPRWIGAAIAGAQPDLFIRLMARLAAPSSNRHGALLIFERLATGAHHRTIAGWAMHSGLPMFV